MFYNLKQRNSIDLEKKPFILFVGKMLRLQKLCFCSRCPRSAPGYFLVCVGGWLFTGNERSFNSNLKKWFAFGKSINEQKLNILFSIVFCLLYPSVRKRFGIPIVKL